MIDWRFWESASARAAREAARWRVEMEEPNSQAKVDEFERWLRKDPAHLRAYEQFDTLAATGQRLTTGEAILPVAASRRWWPVAGAAALALVVFIGVVLWARPVDTVATVIANRGEAVRTVTIGGQTAATLDTNSAIEVDSARTTRSVKLVEGRVLLVVHRAAGESLTVVAQTTTIHATDCTIDIAIIDGGVRIRLVAGHAAISRGGGGEAPRALAVDRPVMVRTGVVTEVVEAGSDTSWMFARVGFDDAPLADVLAVANRTGEPKISVADPSLAKLRVTAVLDLRDMHKLARKLAAALDLQVVDRSNALMLSR